MAWGTLKRIGPGSAEYPSEDVENNLVLIVTPVYWHGRSWGLSNEDGAISSHELANTDRVGQVMVAECKSKNLFPCKR
jgi:hypothetical protein